MSRAEIRRVRREQHKAETATYNLTKAQLEALVTEQVNDKLKKAKQDATYDAVNTAMVLFLTLPMEVLKKYYWQKSFKKRIPEFNAHVLAYYQKWQDGELDINKLRDELWEYTGIRLEEQEI